VHKLKGLKVSQKALDFTVLVRQTTKSFPKDELFVLAVQFHRAADSIALNLAEGAGNSSRKEFCKFLNYSIRSGFECIACTDIACANGLISCDTHESLICRINEIIAMLDGLQKRLMR